MARSRSAFRPDPAEYAKLTPAKKRELRDLLAVVEKGFERNPLAAYVPHTKQIEFHSGKERKRAFYGGNRTGKSTAGTRDDLVQVLPPEFVPPHLRPYKRFGWDEPAFARVITPDLGHTMEVIIDEFRAGTPREALVGDSWEGAFDKTKRVLRFKCGSRVDFMSFEQEPDKFGGVKLHRVHYDEEPRGPNSERIRRESRMRLIDFGGDEIFTFTPLLGLSWVYDLLWAKRGEPDTLVIQASMYDNPYLSPDEIEEAAKDLTKEEKQAIVYGEPVHFEGRFYDDFKEAFHVRKPPAPKDLEGQDVVVGIDPGLKRTGVIWVAFDNDNAALAFEELYESEVLIPGIAEKIKERNRYWGVEKPRYVIDPSARNRATVNAEQVEAEYAREGVYCEHGQASRATGILEVKRRLERGNLVVSEDCKNLIWEFPRYRRDAGSHDEFAAIKEDDHLLDALRYVVMARTWTLPRQALRHRHVSWNENPLVEPPWRGPPAKSPPPLGAY